MNAGGGAAHEFGKMQRVSEARRPVLSSQFHQSVAKGPWAGYPTTLSLSFCTCRWEHQQLSS